VLGAALKPMVLLINLINGYMQLKLPEHNPLCCVLEWFMSHLKYVLLETWLGGQHGA
jgi:hypothetical protein